MGCGKSQYLRFHLNLTTYDGKMVPCMHLPLTCLPMQRRAVERFLTSGDAAGGSCASDCRDLLWVERGAGGESEEEQAGCLVRQAIEPHSPQRPRPSVGQPRARRRDNWPLGRPCTGHHQSRASSNQPQSTTTLLCAGHEVGPFEAVCGRHSSRKQVRLETSGRHSFKLHWGRL